MLPENYNNSINYSFAKIKKIQNKGIFFKLIFIKKIKFLYLKDFNVFAK